MNTAAALGFLTRCFGRQETIAVLLRRGNPASITQRIVRLEQAAAPAYLRWLAHENAAGADVYVAANPVRSGSRKRTKESVAEIRHLYLDIDSQGDIQIAALLASERVPTPTTILSTSAGKYQVLWRVQGFNLAEQEQALKLLTIAFSGDPACTDCNRVLRLPGFHNCKYSPAPLVTAEYLRDMTLGPEDFHLPIDTPEGLPPLPRDRGARSPKKQTNSEQDWAWVLAELTSGKDEAQLSHELALRRPDKPNPRYYAERTVDMAAARLSLLRGLTIEQVITRLQERSQCELPAARRSVRAREIAHTAARMIARKQIA